MRKFSFILCSSTLVTTTEAWCPTSTQLVVPNTILRSTNSGMRIRKYESSTTSTTTSLSEAFYTKGAEIFPECNKREFTLADSFPNGNIPPMAQDILKDEAPDVLRMLMDKSEEGEEESSELSRRNIILLASTALVAGTASSQYVLNSGGN